MSAPDLINPTALVFYEPLDRHASMAETKLAEQAPAMLSPIVGPVDMVFIDPLKGSIW